MEKSKVSEFLKKYTMVIVLVIVVLFFNRYAALYPDRR